MYKTATRKCFAAPCTLAWRVVQRGRSPYIPASSFGCLRIPASEANQAIEPSNDHPISPALSSVNRRGSKTETRM